MRVLGLFTMAVHWQVVVGADLRRIVSKLSDSLDTWLSHVNLHIKYKLSTLEVYKYALFQENMHFHSFFNAPICVHEKKL